MPTNAGPQIRIAVCDGSRMGTQLLAEALARNARFSIIPVENAEDVLREDVDIALISASIDGQLAKACELAKQFRAARPNSPVIMLVEKPGRAAVLEIFRSGARGIFCRTGALSALEKCILSVHSGQVWAADSDIHHLLEAVGEPVKLRLMDAKGKVLLSNREQEVARWVVEGLSNREIALRMNLSEHTVKNYLFRIFDKLGISNRVELILYAFSQLRPAPAPSPTPASLAPAVGCANCVNRDVGECAAASFSVAETYNEGVKVMRDRQSALMWYSVAVLLAARVSERSRTAKSELAADMDPAEVKAAEHRAVEWVKHQMGATREPAGALLPRSCGSVCLVSDSEDKKLKRIGAPEKAVASSAHRYSR